MRAFFEKYNKFFLTLLFIASVITLLSLVEPAAIIEKIGAKNVYIVTFLFAIFGGVSAFTATTFYATLFTLALGGANPFILAAFSALGVLLGDFVFWFFGVQGRELASEAIGRPLERFADWLRKKPKLVVQIIIYLYTGFSPLPGDFLMFTLAVLKYRFRDIVLPTLLGNYTLALLVSLSAIYGLPFVDSLF